MVLQFGVHTTKTTKIGNIEHRLLLTISFFAALSLTSLSNLAVVDANFEELMDAIKCYAACEASGTSLGLCNHTKQEISKYDNHSLGAATFTLIGLLPFVILIFIIDWNIAGRFVKKLLMHGRQHYSHGQGNQRSAAISTFSPAPVTSVSNW